LLDVPELPELEEPVEAPNPVRAEHARAILAVAAPHLHDSIILAVHTGLRLNEIVGLERDQYDAANRLLRLTPASKSKRGDVVFINEVAHQLLLRLIDEADKAEQTRLILYRGAYNNRPPQPIDSLKTAWRNAQKRAGLATPYRFHDLRGNFVIEMARQGATPATTRKAARHVDMKTTLRYLAVVDEDMRQAVERISNWTGTDVARPASGSGKSPTPNSHTPRKGRGARKG
jgi:integrase